MKFSLDPTLTFDSRRAAWFPQERILAVADLHLGYAWAHRLSGQLMPVTPMNDTLARLEALQRDYEAREIVVLGDIVHRAMSLPALERELRELFERLSARAQLTFIAGNHDRQLQRVLNDWLLPIKLVPSRRIGQNLVAHGDGENGKDLDTARLVIGHEHPAISLGDGVSTSTKCPCFMVSERIVILPAFSRWAAGTNVRSYPFMSAAAQKAKFQGAVAICGDKLLPVPLDL